MQLTDILIHVNDDINEDKKESLVEQLRDLEGVIAPRFNKDKKQLCLEKEYSECHDHHEDY